MNQTNLIYFPSIILAAVLSCSSCSRDSDYDLSNIDTTAKISVNDLVVPINIDPINLETILDIKDDSKIKKETLSDGTIQYCVKENGNFSADGYTITSANISEFTDKQTESSDLTISSSSKSTTATSTFSVTGNIPALQVRMNLTSGAIDNAVLSVENIKLAATITLNLQINNLSSIINNINIKNLKVQCIPGLTVTSMSDSKASYDATTGMITLPEDISTGESLSYSLTMNVSGMDCDKAGMTFNNHILSLVDKVSVKNGSVVFTNNDLKAGKTVSDIPATAYYTLQDNFSESTVKSFTGNITKSVKVDNINPIDLSNLPDILTQTGTSIQLAEPRLSIDINNPMKQGGTPSGMAYDNLNSETKITLTGNDAYTSPTITLDKAENKIELSPASQPQEGYTLVKFDDLKNILTGNGVPRKIDIAIEDPTVPVTRVSDFTLGDSFKATSGTWAFYTPLTLTDQSKLKYNKDWSDWSSEDLNYLTIEEGTLMISVTNNTPLAIESLDFTLNNVGKTKTLKGEYTKEIVAGGSTDIEMPLQGDVINNIDGAVLNCNIKGGLTQGQEESLQPSQTVTVSNVKVKVSGFYQKKF